MSDEREMTVVESAPETRTVSYAGWSANDLEALRQTVAKDCDEAQFKVFVMAAKRLGLDPFARQIVPIVQGGRMTPQTTIDGLRLIAERTRKYGGQLGPFWCGKDGIWHEAWLDDGPPAAAKVAVIRRDFQEPMWGVARFKSYAKGGTWEKLPDVMIAKVAESLALRKAFPNELSGLYTDVEMSVVEADTPHSGSRSVVPESADHSTPSTQPRQRPAAPARSPQAWNPLADKELRQRLTKLGYRTVSQVQEFMATVGQPASRENAFAVLESIEADAEERAHATDLHEAFSGGVRP